MGTTYGSFCDDFYVNMNLNTELELPRERDTILHFFERIQRQFPTMNTFYQRETGEFCLEENREVLAAHVVREVNNKLRTGLKSGKVDR